MSSSKLYTNYALVIDTIAEATTEVIVDSIQSMSLNSNLRTQVVGGDGSVFASFGSLVAGAPVAAFTTLDLKTLMDLTGTSHYPIDTDVDNDGVRMYWQRLASGGTRDAQGSGTHIETLIAGGLLVLRSLTLPHQGPATLSAEIFVIDNGTDLPVVFNEAANLPAGVDPTVDVTWTLGKVVLNATEVDGLSGVSVEFGVSVLRDTKDSDIYPTFVSIAGIQPMITLSGVHVDVLSTLTEDGAYFTASQVVFYARKRAEGGTFVADGTAEHIKFTLGKCRVDWSGVSGDPKTITMRITPWDTPGGVAPIAVSTASAIT